MQRALFMSISTYYQAVVKLPLTEMNPDKLFAVMNSITQGRLKSSLLIRLIFQFSHMNLKQWLYVQIKTIVTDEPPLEIYQK